MSFVEFNTEKLENYNWNYLDYYVSTRGGQDEFTLDEKLKHWRFRLYVLPVKPFLAHTAVIKERREREGRCDLYTAPSPEENVNMAEGFLRFVETCLNKVKRPNSVQDQQRRRTRCSTMANGDLKPSFQRFRERVGSNQGLGGRGRDRVVSGPSHSTARCCTGRCNRSNQRPGRKGATGRRVVAGWWLVWAVWSHWGRWTGGRSRAARSRSRPRQTRAATTLCSVPAAGRRDCQVGRRR
jgi:hypothetical protein